MTSFGYDATNYHDNYNPGQKSLILIHTTKYYHSECQVKMSAIYPWRRLKSFSGRVKGLRSSKSTTNEHSGIEMEGPSSTDERNSSRWPSTFEPTRRRTATCSAMEEEDQRHDISLAKLRKDLILWHILNKCGLLQ